MPFTNNLPEWNKSDDAKPSQTKLNEGWEASEKPPASMFNWFFNKTYLALKDLVENAIHKEEKAKANGVATLDAATKVPVAQLPTGTTAAVGAVRLNDAIDSTLTTQAATANAVRKTYELANGKAAATVATASENGLMSKEDKARLDGVEMGANKYTHPSNHPAEMITEDANRIFMTPTERTKLEGIDGAFNDHAISISHVPYATASGANAKTITLNPAPSAYVDGLALSFKNTSTNTGAVTINVNGRGVKSVLDSKGAAIKSGKLVANSVYTIRYNGTAFILQGEGGDYDIGDIVPLSRVSAHEGPTVATTKLVRDTSIATISSIRTHKHVVMDGSDNILLQTAANTLQLRDGKTGVLIQSKASVLKLIGLGLQFYGDYGCYVVENGRYANVTIFNKNDINTAVHSFTIDSNWSAATLQVPIVPMPNNGDSIILAMSVSGSTNGIRAYKFDGTNTWIAAYRLSTLGLSNDTVPVITKNNRFLFAYNDFLSGFACLNMLNGTFYYNGSASTNYKYPGKNLNYCPITDNVYVATANNIFTGTGTTYIGVLSQSSLYVSTRYTEALSNAGGSYTGNVFFLDVEDGIGTGCAIVSRVSQSYDQRYETGGLASLGSSTEHIRVLRTSVGDLLVIQGGFIYRYKPGIGVVGYLLT